MPKPARCYLKRYVIEMTVPQFKRGLRRDSQDMASSLCEQLMDKTEAVDIEYDGHFGPQVMFELRDEHDTPEEHKKIADLVAAWCR